MATTVKELQERVGIQADNAPHETRIAEKLALGDQLEIPTLLGKVKFTVKEINDKFDTAYLESSETHATTLTRHDDGWWHHSYFSFNPKAVAKCRMV